MADELLLGVDVGSESTKGVLATLDGRVVAEAQVAHRMLHPHPGWAEHDAQATWWGGLVAVCRELLDEGRGAAVRAVGVSGIGPCFCPADAEGRPLRRAILYGIDTRATAEGTELEERLGREEVLRRTGSVLSSQAVGPKLLWYRRHEPERFARTRYLLPSASFLVLRLTGEYVVDRHCASGFGPLYDVRAGRWIDEWVAEVLGEEGPPLPRPAWASEPAGEVSERTAAETGLRPGTPVAVGTVDAVAEALSIGVRRPGDLMLMYGTTFFLIAILDELRLDARLWTKQYVLPDTTTLGAGMATGGALTSWLRSLLAENDRAPDYEALLADAAATPPGADGLVVLPYFSGERTPLHDPLARGAILGLTLRHGRGHLYRALLESTGYAVRHILETMSEAGARVHRVVAVGGGTRSALWPQIVSDVTGVEQELPAVTVGAAYGDCLLGAIAAGLLQADTDWTRPERRVEPDEARTRAYAEPYRIYRELYPATRELAHALARHAEATGGAGDGAA